MSAWRFTVPLGDVWGNENLSLPEKGKVIGERLGRLRLFAFPDDTPFELMIEELVDAATEDDVRWFDVVWGEVYDWADRRRVWIDIWSAQAAGR